MSRTFVWERPWSKTEEVFLFPIISGFLISLIVSWIPFLMLYLIGVDISWRSITAGIWLIVTGVLFSTPIIRRYII